MNKKPSAFIRAIRSCALIALAGVCLYPSVKAQSSGGDACAANLKQIAVAVAAYTQDYDGALPPMGSVAATAGAVSPYIQNLNVLDCPVTDKPYLPNAALSSRPLAKLPKPGMVFLFRDAIAHPGGRFTVLFADGHITHQANSRSPKKS